MIEKREKRDRQTDRLITQTILLYCNSLTDIKNTERKERDIQMSDSLIITMKEKQLVSLKKEK